LPIERETTPERVDLEETAEGRARVRGHRLRAVARHVLARETLDRVVAKLEMTESPSNESRHVSSAGMPEPPPLVAAAECCGRRDGRAAHQYLASSEL
jgi:hypothetical protein